MRWEALFADLQAQSAAQQQDDFEAEVAHAVDLEWSRTPLCDRFRANIGRRISLRLTDGASLGFRVEAVGGDWASGSVGAQQWLIPLQAVVSAVGLLRRAQSEPSPSQRRLGISAPLRALAAAQEHVVVYGRAGEATEGVLVGVGRDFIDLRRPGGRAVIRTVPVYALVGVRSDRACRCSA